MVYSVHEDTKFTGKPDRSSSQCWNILSAYENFTHRGLNFSSTFSLTINSVEHFNGRRSRSRSARTEGQADRNDRRFFIFRRCWVYFLATVSGIPGTRSSRFQRRSLSNAPRGKREPFSFSTVATTVSSWNRESYQRYLGFLQRATVSSRKYGTLCDTSGVSETPQDVYQ